MKKSDQLIGAYSHLATKADAAELKGAIRVLMALIIGGFSITFMTLAYLIFD